MDYLRSQAGLTTTVAKKKKRARTTVRTRSARQRAVPLTGTAADQANRQRFMAHQRVDDLAQAFVSVTAEMWIVKDRLAVLEQVLAKHGIPAPAASNRLSPATRSRTSWMRSAVPGFNA